jgi:hypothetical protein
MATQPPLDFTALATRLVNSCAEKNFIAVAEVLEQLVPDRVDMAVFVNSRPAEYRPDRPGAGRGGQVIGWV